MILIPKNRRGAATAERADPGHHASDDRTMTPETGRLANPRPRATVSALLALVAGRCGDMVSLITALDRLRRVGVNLNRSLRLARLQGSPLTSEETGLVRECLEFVDHMRANQESGREAMTHG